MGDAEDRSYRPALNGATRSYIVTAAVCFAIVGLLLLGYAQEDAAKKAKEAAAATAVTAPGNNVPDQLSRNDRVDELARKSQGKFSALDKADQDFLNGSSSGHGAEMLQMRWAALNNSGNSAPEPEAKIREAIERTKGDYSKLTAEEKARMDDFTQGHGKEYFESRVKQWKGSLRGKGGEPAQKGSPSATTAK
jgi:hypothetical protein